MNIGDKIRILRLERGYTLEELGNMVGVGKSTVRKWETGYIKDMRRDKIGKLAAALGVTPDYFLIDNAEPPAPDPLEEKRQRLMSELAKLSEEDLLKVLEYAKFITRDK